MVTLTTVWRVSWRGTGLETSNETITVTSYLMIEISPWEMLLFDL